MELNLNSLHARIYKNVLFVENYEMPKSLCAYFWKSVLMWLFMPILIVVLLPMYIFRTVSQRKHIERDEAWGLSIVVYLSLLMGYSIAIFFYCLFADVSKEYMKEMEFFIFVGFISCFILFILGIIYGVGKVHEYRNKKRWERVVNGIEPKQNVIVEAIKGFYNKHCPRITWKSENN